MLQQNQRLKKPFYPRDNMDVRVGKKNKFDIPKQKGEIRVVCCDMAFVENKKNDNSIFSCGRLVPEYTRYKRDSDETDKQINNGYKVMIPYMESVQGGDTLKQALRIRQLFEDFSADYIVLDLRNAGRNAVQIWKLSGLLVRKISGTLRCQSEQKAILRIDMRNA